MSRTWHAAAQLHCKSGVHGIMLSWENYQYMSAPGAAGDTIAVLKDLGVSVADQVNSRLPPWWSCCKMAQCLTLLVCTYHLTALNLLWWHPLAISLHGDDRGSSSCHGIASAAACEPVRHKTRPCCQFRFLRMQVTEGCLLNSIGCSTIMLDCAVVASGSMCCSPELLPTQLDMLLAHKSSTESLAPDCSACGQYWWC